MNDGAMKEIPERAGWVVDYTQNAKEASLLMEKLPVRAGVQRTGYQHCRQAGRETQRAPAKAQAPDHRVTEEENDEE
jgi:hypothetical protein